MLFDNLIENVSKLFLQKEQLAKILNISLRAIMAWQYRCRGFLARKLGRHVRYSLPEVLKYHQKTFGGRNGI